MSWPAIALLMIGWIFSLCLHEYAHAIVAYLGGDKGVKDRGYLSFNPVAYAHPILSIVFPLVFLVLGGIGLPGGCVFVDRTRLKNRHWECAVSLAGPAASLIFFVVLAAPFYFGWIDGYAGEHHWALSVYAALAALQFYAVLLNLLPIPPLDGFGAIAPYLPASLRDALDFLYVHGTWIFIFLLFGGAFQPLWIVVSDALRMSGIPGGWAKDGLDLCRIH